ncbi:mitochondrial cation transporter [Kalaharituber pfeilii]|nr:mitochondrial cation transporter [Kalaharituber pfeilii]
MSSSIPGPISLPPSPYNLSTYWGRVRQSLDLCDPRTLFTTSSQLSAHVNLISQYKNGIITEMTPELWKAKKVVDATLHPDTGEKVLLPFRMSAFVFSNLVVTVGMLTPNLSTRAILAWQITNQSLNVAINASNANKSTPLSLPQMATSYLLAVSSSCGVALGLNSLVPKLKNVSPSTKLVLGRLVPFAAVVTAGVVNVGVMRGGEILGGIDVYPSLPKYTPSKSAAPSTAMIPTSQTASPGPASSEDLTPTTSLGKSRHCALLAVSQTALSRVLNATPIMVIPPLILISLQKRWKYLQRNPRAVLPVNLGLIFVTSVFALPLALGAFPQRQAVRVQSVEGHIREELKRRGGDVTGVKKVEFNRGI